MMHMQRCASKSIHIPAWTPGLAHMSFRGGSILPMVKLYFQLVASTGSVRLFDSYAD